MINPDCPQCRERIQKDACSCEDRYNSLQSKYQKLVIVFAIVSGIVGKTIVEEAMSLFETAAPIVDTISSNENQLQRLYLTIQNLITILIQFYLQMFLLCFLI